MSLPNLLQSPNRSEAKSFISYIGDGATNEYSFNFEYLRREFIKVEIDGVRVLSFIFKDASTILLQSPVAEGAVLTIKRITDSSRIVTFIDGSILKSTDLNISAIQTVHIAEEGRDYMTNTVGVDDEGNIDARFKRVVRVKNAVADDDAVNKRYVDSEGQFAMSNAYASAQAAKASEVASKDSEGKAKTSEDKTKASEVAAKASEDKAKASETNAKASEVAAKASENTVVPLVPVVDQASKDAAKAALMADEASKRAEQAVVDVKNLGAVPIGAVLAFIKEPLPAGYLALRGGKFDKLTFPDLFTYLGADDLPNFTDRTPKMTGTDLDLLEKQGWCWPTHNHTFSGQTDAQGAHGHNAWTGTDGHHQHAVSSWNAGGNTIGSMIAGTHQDTRYWNWNAPIYSRANEGAHTHSVGVEWAQHHAHSVSGTTSQAGNSDRVEVDRIGVIYAIKAAGILANEGMAQLDGVLGRVGDLEACNRDVITPELVRLDIEKLNAPIAQHLYQIAQIFGLPTGRVTWTAAQWQRVPSGTYWFDGSYYNNAEAANALDWLGVPASKRPYPHGNVTVMNTTYATTFTLISHGGVSLLTGIAYGGEISPKWIIMGKGVGYDGFYEQRLWSGSHGINAPLTLEHPLMLGDTIMLLLSNGGYKCTQMYFGAGQYTFPFGDNATTCCIIQNDSRTLTEWRFVSGYPVTGIYRMRNV